MVEQLRHVVKWLEEGGLTKDAEHLRAHADVWRKQGLPEDLGVSAQGEEPYIFRHSLFDFNPNELWLEIDGERKHLMRTESLLLLSLVRNINRVVPYDQLIREVWGEEYISNSSTHKLYIWYLRNKLVRGGKRLDAIRTIYKVGYMLVDPAEPLPPK